MEELIPGIPQVGVFDTAFHQSMEPHAYMYGIPYVLYKNMPSAGMAFTEPATGM